MKHPPLCSKRLQVSITMNREDYKIMTILAVITSIPILITTSQFSGMGSNNPDDLHQGSCISGNCEDGFGTWTYTDKTTYVGEWSIGKKHGEGIVTWPNGYIYKGEFKESKWHGQGTLTFPDGTTYVGEWRDGFMNGQGTFTNADGTVKKGIWKNGALVEPN